MPSTFLFDLDGTLYRGEDPIPFAAEAVCALRDAGAHVAYLTNNSTLTVLQFTQKLERLGFPTEGTLTLSTSAGAARLLARRRMKEAYVIGEGGLRESLLAEGVAPTEEDAPAVVVGLDREVTYAKLAEAMRRVRAGASFVATNRDLTYPLEAGRLIPGTGALVAALVACTGREPEVVGKPMPTLVLQALDHFGVRPEEAVVVGDRLDTDIAAGRAAGCPTWLVLTGVETELPPGQPGSPDLRGLLEFVQAGGLFEPVPGNRPAGAKVQGDQRA